MVEATAIRLTFVLISILLTARQFLRCLVYNATTKTQSNSNVCNV
jgi:hypothetical protein